MPPATANDLTSEYRAKPASVRVFYQGKKISGAWLEWDESILKPRLAPSRGFELDHAKMLEQLRTALEATPLFFTDNKLRIVALLPRVGRSEKSIARLLRSAQIAQDVCSLEITCIKKAEYDRFNQFLVPGGYPVVQENPSATSLILLPQNEQITAIIHAHMLELVRISTGRITLIG